MGKPIVFSEARIKALKPPEPGPGGKYRQVYHKDKTFPGLQVCVTSSGAKSYYFVRRMDGKPTRVMLGTVAQLSVDDARKAAAKRAAEVAGGKNPQVEHRARQHEPTLQDLWKQWQLYATAHKKPRSVAEDKRQFDKFLTPWAGRRLSSIRKADVQELHSRIGRDNGPYQANRVLALLRSMFNRADTLGYRGDNPAAGVKMFREESRDRFLQAGEMEAFLTALDAEPPTFRDFFLLALLTGARRSNVQAMRWADLDLAGDFWRIPETKGGMVVVVPLVAPAVAILAARRGHANGAEWVFPSHGRAGHIMDPKASWKRVLAAAKLADLRVHDLRRSVGSWMAGQNVSLTIIGKVLGHKTSQATMIYSRVAMDPQRDALNAATSAMMAAGKPKLLTGPQQEGSDDGQA
jgi:integrase